MSSPATPFYTIREHDGRWFVCLGAVYGEYGYPTAQKAKGACWAQHHIVAIKMHAGDEVLYDPEDQFHRALAELESTYNTGNEVVAVGATNYLIRRGKFSLEVPVAWRCEPTNMVGLGLLVTHTVHARDMRRYVYETEHAT